MKKISLVLFIITIFLLSFANKIIAVSNENYPIKFGVILYRGDDHYLNLVKSYLLKIEDENKGLVEFSFYDSKEDKQLQNSQIDELINKNVDVILLNLVDVHDSEAIINKIKKSNIPVILFNREPASLNWIKSYDKSLYVGTEACESGNIQAEIIIEEIKRNNLKDKNKNESLEIILLQGEPDNIEAQLRSECVIRKLNNRNIRTNIIAEEYCNWEKECATQKIEELFLKFGDSIELIISNNDEMAIGAVSALQKYGYNTGDPNKYIAIVGVDGTEEARALIEKGFMNGTIIQDSEEMANALYRIGKNLAKGIEPLEDTEYKFDVTGIGVRIPYNGYIMRGR